MPQRKDVREVQVEMERVKKWLKMRKEMDQGKLNPDKLRRRIYKGIPDKLRGDFWSRLMNVKELKTEQKGKYEVSY